MTMFEFGLMPDSSKLNILYEQGVYVGKRKAEKLSVLLYQLETFYVEVYYKKHRHHVSRIYCFSSTTLLDPYLEQIDVEHLV